MNEMDELKELFGEYFAKAIERECKTRRMSLIKFFYNAIESCDDDAFCDYVADLCKKHKISLPSEDW